MNRFSDMGIPITASRVEQARAYKERVEPFRLPREFRTPAYWWPAIVRPDPADDISNHVPLDPDGD